MFYKGNPLIFTLFDLGLYFLKTFRTLLMLDNQALKGQIWLFSWIFSNLRDFARGKRIQLKGKPIILSLNQYSSFCRNDLGLFFKNTLCLIFSGFVFGFQWGPVAITLQLYCSKPQKCVKVVFVQHFFHAVFQLNPVFSRIFRSYIQL